jgi:tripartite-type tricarboxylate transporter receptor subunit TctC
MFKKIITAGAALALSAAGALAQYPTKPIRVVVPFASGSSTDVVMRILAQPLGQSLGQTIVVDNRPGGDGAIAAELVAKSPSDGYTLLLATNSPLSAVPHLRKKPPYDAIKDFMPITMIGRYTFLVMVNAGVPAKTLADLFNQARANPGKLNYATGNTSSIVMTAMLQSMAGVKMAHIPYKSEPPAVVDLISNQVQVMVSSYATVAAHMREGRLRPLAIALNQRSTLVPNVPTIAEAGFPKFTLTPWAGLFGPAKMPKTVVDKLNSEFNAQLKRPEIRAQLDQQAFAGEGSTPDWLATWTRQQLDTWGATMRDAGIQPE